MSDWVKIFNSLPAHLKILRAGDRAAWLYVCGLCYSNEHLTDGFIAHEVLVVAAPGVKSPTRLAAKLVEVGLWHEVQGGWEIHDYADHQRTSAQVKDLRRKDAERKAKKTTSATGPDSDRIPSGLRPESARTPTVEKRREEKTPHSPPGDSLELEEWLAHYERATSHPLPGRGTKAFHSIAAAYRARRDEGYTADDLKLATIGAHADDYRRENGYDVAESILRPTKIAALIAKGKLRSGSRGTVTSVELGNRLRGDVA